MCSAGPARATQVLREALARGADRAIHVEGDAFTSADAFVVAEALAGAIRDEKFDLVLTGLQSDDQGFGQVGVVLAESSACRTPRSSWKCRSADRLRAGSSRETRARRGLVPVGTLPLPALLTIQSGINQLRYATLKGIMAAKKKEIRKVAPPVGVEPAQKILSRVFPEKGKQTQMISGSPAEAAKELVRELRDEARVI